MSAHFDIEATPLAGLLVVQRKPRSDARGSFQRIFCDEELRAAGVRKPVVQINQSLTSERGTVRGLHYQSPPSSEMKIVSCVRGAAFDVAVDLRRGSPTFLKWFGIELSEANCRTAVIPEGFAHGFQALTADCMLLYLHTAHYDKGSERGISATDPTLSIEWPEPPVNLSPRDRSLPLIDTSFGGFSE